MRENIRRKIQTFILLFSFIAFCCSDSPTGSFDSITINIPMQQKAVRAIAYYNSMVNSDSLVHLRVSSFYFDSTVTSNDTTYLFGIYERLESDSNDEPISGEIIVSLTDDWVFYQSSEIFDAGVDLLKPFNNLTADTTSLPTELYGYFPIYPRTLIRNVTYSIYRPANEGEGWGYGGVYREFRIKNLVVWNDHYGTEFGFEVIIEHILFGFTINFDLVIDRHGILNSHSSFVHYVMSPEGAIVDSAITHVVNRRIVDYSDPSSVRSLSYYANEVLENGLKFN